MIYRQELKGLLSIGLGSILLVFVSCSDVELHSEKPLEVESLIKSTYQLSQDELDHSVFYNDTFLVSNSQELLESIGSNRLIKLASKDYAISSNLIINQVKNLRIEGGLGLKIQMTGKGKNVVLIKDSHNIQLDSLVISPSLKQGLSGDPGVLRIQGSYNISLNHCQIIGSSGFGLVTEDALNFKFINSEIRSSTDLIFELQKSRKCYFSNSVFQDNNLNISVLGGFTFGTREVYFTECLFKNNQPKFPGNPLFNFMENVDLANGKIVFKDCSFRNNKGYKWYGEKMELINCKIDSTDFIDFPKPLKIP